MKQIAVISGKGGTGKTVLTGALASFLGRKVMADCDVDAADLHLLLAPVERSRNAFKSGFTAFIDGTKCLGCGQCIDVCRFDAIDETFTVDPMSCEGCAFCARVCPDSAIEMRENTTGEWFLSDTRFGPLVHARLGPAEENSGKLVGVVREQARYVAEREGAEWIVIDGPPGIGCPAIAALTGVDAAVVVTESTRSGLHDADRIITLIRRFGLSVGVIINKWDLNPAVTGKIEAYCKRRRIPVEGKIRFDREVVRITAEGRTVTECADDGVRREWAGPRRAIERRLRYERR